MLHTRFKAESPVLRVGSCHGTQPKVTGLSALPRKANLDKPAACRAPTGCALPLAVSVVREPSRGAILPSLGTGPPEFRRASCVPLNTSWSDRYVCSFVIGVW